MNVIKLGPLLLNVELLTFILSAITGYLALKYRLRQIHAEEKISDKFVYALILGFVIWKFSLVLFDPVSVFQYPMSLLYFSGGDKGLILGIVAALIYIWQRSRKDDTSIGVNVEVLGPGILIGSGVYHLLLLLFTRTGVLYHVLIACLVLGVALVWFFKKNHNIDWFIQRKNGLIILLALILVAWTIYDFTAARKSELEAGKQQHTAGQAEVGIKRGNAAPDFELYHLNGDAVKLSDYAGKKVILNFWATWCPPCRAEMPHMEKVHHNGDQDVVVLAVNLTHTEESPRAAENFVAEYELSIPVILDTTGKVSDRYRIVAYPTSYIIDSRGIIQDIYQGAIHEETMNKVLSRIQ